MICRADRTYGSNYGKPHVYIVGMYDGSPRESCKFCGCWSEVKLEQCQESGDVHEVRSGDSVSARPEGSHNRPSESRESASVHVREGALMSHGPQYGAQPVSPGSTPTSAFAHTANKLAYRGQKEGK